MATSSSATISSTFYAFSLCCAIFAIHVAISSSSSVDFTANLDHRLPQNNSDGLRCTFLTGEDDDTEFPMDSESNRRILAWTRYISYGALRKNAVPCRRRGASYYNCRPGAQANPYRRGCSAITRCRG